jgi:hypothetical protein
VHCFAHTLNLVSENAIKSETTISEVIDKVKRIVTYFKQSCIAAEALRAKQIESGTSEPFEINSVCRYTLEFEVLHVGKIFTSSLCCERYFT